MKGKGSGLYHISISVMRFKTFHILAVLLLVIWSCHDRENYAGDTISGNKVMILGHMGMGIAFSQPGNSYESVSTAISIGCDGSEIDVQLTLDSVLVAYHDKDLSTQTNCKGRIADMTWDEISSCKYSLAVKPVFLYRVEDILSRFGNMQELYFSFDCKTETSGNSQDAYEYRFLRAIRRFCEKYGMTDQVFIEGQNDFLDKARQMGLKNRLFLYAALDTDPVGRAKNKYGGIVVPKEIEASEILKAEEIGLKVMVYSPGNYSENKAALKRKPDIIQTDDPITILKLLERFNYENTTP